MAQRPILFSTPMVQAILEGRKTMTRRIVKAEIKEDENAISFKTKKEFHSFGKGFDLPKNLNNPFTFFNCPYGNVGDVIWVRENFKVQEIIRYFDSEWRNKVCIDFVADDSRHWYNFNESDKPTVLKRKHPTKVFISPNIFLPKKCSRIWLEITDIKVERLQDISTSDACEEGINYWNVDVEAFEGGELVADYENYTWKDDPNYEDYHFSHYANPIDSFRSLWQSINGVESWNENPFVWCISFKRIEKPNSEQGVKVSDTTKA